MPTKKKPGRPRSTNGTKRYPLRHKDKQMRAWQLAALADRRPLQDWMRNTLDEKAAETMAAAKAQAETLKVRS